MKLNKFSWQIDVQDEHRAHTWACVRVRVLVYLKCIVLRNIFVVRQREEEKKHVLCEIFDQAKYISKGQNERVSAENAKWLLYDNEGRNRKKRHEIFETYLHHYVKSCL